MDILPSVKDFPHYNAYHWGVCGFSMGGHVAYLTSFLDTRIRYCVVVAGTPSMYQLMVLHAMAENVPLNEHALEPMRNYDLLEHGGRMTTPHLLAIYASGDAIVPYWLAQRLIEDYGHGKDWQLHIQEGGGHYMTSYMRTYIRQWLYPRLV
jgi:fermentation-respiration switch protein FrsA (DUF1100 family)